VEESDTECVVRIPLVPGFNDDEDNIRKTANFLAHLKRPPRLDLLPFNILASSRYSLIGLDSEYRYKNAKRQPDEVIDKLVKIAAAQGINVNTQGLW
jgi:pyruvate formate lyase activating enzyme